MCRKPASRSRRGSRERILNAAIERFSRTSYEQTGLRDIAAAAGVDVAYVHRCFGSKGRLFAEALKASVDIADLVPAPAEDFASALASRTFSRRTRRRQALDIFVRSISSEQAGPILRQFILDSVINPLAARSDRPSGRRIALIVALLAGVDIFRNVLRIGPMLEAKGGELETLIASAIQGVMMQQSRR